MASLRNASIIAPPPDGSTVGSISFPSKRQYVTVGLAPSQLDIPAPDSLALAGHANSERPYLTLYRERLAAASGGGVEWLLSEEDRSPLEIV